VTVITERSLPKGAVRRLAVPALEQCWPDRRGVDLSIAVSPMQA
jgi:hypothetical protein